MNTLNEDCRKNKIKEVAGGKSGVMLEKKERDCEKMKRAGGWEIGRKGDRFV